MEVTETYDLPFDSRYDWRVTLFSQFKDLAVQAATEIVQTLDEKECPLPWNDDIGILQLALQKKWIEAMNKRIIGLTLQLTR